MAQELIYTSTEKGIRPGTTGFCTVAYTRGMTRNCISLLESLSGYRAPATAKGRPGIGDPVAYSHYRFKLDGENINVLSRISAMEADHTQRSNKIAHHVVLGEHERPPAGPAWLCRQEDFFVTSWEGQPCIIEEEKTIPQQEVYDTYAATWAKVTGDAGWAGVLAQAFETNPREPAYLVFQTETDLLALLDESVALVRPKNRWQVTFHTVFREVPPGTQCVWRCCTADQDVLRRVHGRRQCLVIDLKNPGACSKNSSIVRCAREGFSLDKVYRKAGSSAQEDGTGMSKTSYKKDEYTSFTEGKRKP